MQIEVVPAGAADRSTLENLLELYLHDFSEITQERPDERGRFGYSYLSLYWRDRRRHPFLFRVDGSAAGFALVQQGSEISDDAEAMDLVEFFVVRSLRRRGLGMVAAQALFSRFPLTWEIRVMEANPAALAFWQASVSRFVGDGFECFQWSGPDQVRWQVFRFSAAPVAG